MNRILFLLLLLAVPLSGQKNVPKLSQWATDLTNTLSREETDQLNGRLKAFEDTTSNQFVVLMISTLDDYPIEDYSYQVARQNKIGSAKNDNGVLLLIAKDDRKMRIEVGYGLEGVIPDAVASSIIRNVIIPRFKEDDYYRGISEGVTAIMAAIGGEYKAEKEKGQKKPGGGIFTILMIIFILMMLFGRGRRGGIGRAILLGGLAGRGFGSGNWGGSSRGGGFGGFSGGGGSFGGGGASGSW